VNTRRADILAVARIGIVAKYMAMSGARSHAFPQLVWEDHEKYVRQLLLDGLPQTVREFGQWMKDCHVEKLLPLAQKEFLETVHTYDGKASIPWWLNELAKRVVKNNFKAIRGAEPLVDEETVRLIQAGSETAEGLMERYLPKIQEITTRIVYTKGICPRHIDVNSFVGDVVGEASRKVFNGLPTYRFAAPFKYWVETICENVAYDLRDKELGQAAAGPREYISWDDFQVAYSDTSMEDTSRMLVRQLLDEHGHQGPRAAKSKDALVFTYYEGLSAKEVAERLATTPAYVNQLISHDYREIRKIAEEKHGLRGSDL
jgi:DNA-directed RNA polymerase specialized sigma24 family protein